MANERDQRVLEAYEAWDPIQTPLGEFLTVHGIARQSLYNILARNNVTPKTFRRTEAPGPSNMNPGHEAARVLGHDLAELLRVAEWYLQGHASKEALEQTVARLREVWMD